MAPRKHRVPSAVDAAGVELVLGGSCGLYIDLQLEDAAPIAGDWIGTPSGSRYLVDDAHLVRSARHRQVKRYRLRTLRLPKHAEPPADVRYIELAWYPRARSR